MQNRLTPVARNLRRNQTEAEKRLWSRLRSRQLAGAKFVRQLPIDRFIADFACRECKLIVELDGGQHAENVADIERTRLLAAHGYRVIRLWNADVMANMDGVLQRIAEALEEA